MGWKNKRMKWMAFIFKWHLLLMESAAGTEITVGV
jgi:hypothetical protein